MTKAKIIGTYQIINTLDQKSYVGSSDDITRRWMHHKTDLKNGALGKVNSKGKKMKHHCKPLQRAWIKYGADAFEFHILERNDTAEESLQDEQLLLNALFDNGETCYNTAPDATAPMRGRTPWNKGKKLGPYTQEHKDAMSAGMTGKKHSPDHCDAIKAAALLRWAKYRAAKALLASTLLPPPCNHS